MVVRYRLVHQDQLVRQRRLLWRFTIHADRWTTGLLPEDDASFQCKNLVK